MNVVVVMPLTYREAVQVALLLACVPLQYMLSQNMELEDTSTLGKIMATDFQYFRDNWLSSESWAKSMFDSLQFIISGNSVIIFPMHSIFKKVLSTKCVNFFYFFFFSGVMPDNSPNMYYGTIGENESPAYEVLRFRQERGYFSSSLAVRWKRPAHIQFRVGQVVKHRSEGYTGVIIGWDLKAKVSTFLIMQ